MQALALVERRTDADRWRAVVERDARCDGQFVFAVRTTGVYCRPSCAARRPHRENVAFFDGVLDAERAGFRPCRRCRPRLAGDPAALAVRRVCRLIERRAGGPLRLADLAAQAGLSPYHLHRTFKRVVGVTPRQYADAVRVGALRRELRGGRAVTDAIYGAGFGSSSRVYERAHAQLGMTPAAYRRGGGGRAISYAMADSPLGRLLVAGTEKGVCFVSLGEADARLEAALRGEYPGAEIRRDEERLGPWLRRVLAHLRGREPHLDLPLDVRATAFQRRVWEELRRIRRGETRTYGEIARRIGRPSAARAVARACATNPVALIVPCHRVVGGDGALTGYRWGVERKRALLERERQG
jgi:AraC family transcriptional regulator of adaptative response/methylated-DNA-[protein]-cysteine methyltransferase